MSVIFSRAPLRISLGGGGTDLPSYYREHGGFLVSGAIDKYVYMLTHTVFQRRYRMKYSSTEEVDKIAEIRHPILRETLLRHWRGNPLEIASVADVPAGTGMGSSGAFTVCLLKGLAHARRTAIAPGALAEAACEIEIDVLGEPVGKQDQYVAAHGGICAYTFNPDGSVEVEPLELDAGTLRTAARPSAAVLHRRGARRRRRCSATRTSAPRRATRRCSRTCTAPRSWATAAASCSLAGDLEAYAELMHEHWENKRRRSPGMASEHIDRLYTLARRSGAIGGKLVGAGGGGFLLVYAQRPRGHEAGDGRRGRAGARLRLRVRRGASARSTGEPQAAERRDRRLRPDRAQAGGGARPRTTRSSAASTSPRRPPPRWLPSTARSACESFDELLGRGPRVVVVAVPHDQLAALAERALDAGAHVLVEKPAGLGTRAGRAPARCGGARRPAGQGRLQPPLSSRHRPRGGRGPFRRARRADAPARPLRPRRPARLRPRVARRAGALGRRRADRPGHAPARPRPTGWPARCRCTRRCCAPTSGTPR